MDAAMIMISPGPSVADPTDVIKIIVHPRVAKDGAKVFLFSAGFGWRAWEQAHGRMLGSTERYAVSKMALFQAFDERATPLEMKQEVRVRGADMAAIIETLGL